jgi:hypothetical protein
MCRKFIYICKKLIKRNEVRYFQNVLYDNVEQSRKDNYCVILNLKYITIRTSANRRGFFIPLTPKGGTKKENMKNSNINKLMMCCMMCKCCAPNSHYQKRRS